MNAKLMGDLFRSLVMAFGGLLVSKGLTDQNNLNVALGALAGLSSAGWSFASARVATMDLARSVLLTLGSLAVAKGYVDQGTVVQVVGAVVTLGGVTWTAVAHGVKPDNVKPLAILLLPAFLLLGGCQTGPSVQVGARFVVTAAPLVPHAVLESKLAKAVAAKCGQYEAPLQGLVNLAQALGYIPATVANDTDALQEAAHAVCVALNG